MGNRNVVIYPIIKPEKESQEKPQDSKDLLLHDLLMMAASLGIQEGFKIIAEDRKPTHKNLWESSSKIAKKTIEAMKL